MSRRKKASVSLSEADKERVERLSKRYKLSMGEISGYLYEMCEKYDMMRVGWEARIEMEDEKREARANDCPRFVLDGKWYVCVTPRLDKAPKKDKLSQDLEASLKMCDNCKALKLEELKKKRERDAFFKNRRTRRSQLSIS